MIKMRANILLMMITNIGTAIVVSAIIGFDNNNLNQGGIAENLDTAKAVPFLLFLVFLLIVITAYILYKLRKSSEKSVYTIQSNTVSNKVSQMKEYYHLENLRREEEVSLEVKNYSIRTMAPYMTVDNIEFLCANIEGWTKSKGITLKPLDVSTVLSSLDLRHFAWNIGERLGWTGQQRAQFIKLTFPQTLQELEVETIRRNLRQKGTCLIQLDIPEHGDFHFQSI